jgi:hypothetical protein
VDYVQAQRWFGSRHYGSEAGEWRSPFDHKQIRFLEPFAVIDFVTAGENGRSRDRINLERVIDRKLQLELIPYASDSFSTSKLSRASSLIERHYERVVSVIAGAPRDYVLFCGAIFEKLLAHQIKARHDHAFSLMKSDGTQMRQRSRFSEITLDGPSGEIVAGIAHSWARQGIPMRAYGERVRSLYGATASE